MSTLVKFPLRSNKAPAVPKGTSWKDFTGKVTTAMWGIAVPKGAFVIDLDTYKGVTRAVVDDLIGCALPWDAAILQRTKNGGEHYAFATTAKITQGKDIAHISGFDTRAAGDGYIATGDGYTELTPFGLDYALLNAAVVLPPLPQMAVDFFSKDHTLSKIEVPADAPATTLDFAQFLLNRSMGLKPDEIADYLQRLPECYVHGDDWLHTGMSIWHETQGSHEGWVLFDEFSQRAPDVYNEAKNLARWRSFGNKTGVKPRTFASVIDAVNKHEAGTTLPSDDEISPDARRLARSIEFRLGQLLGHENVPALEVSPAIIHLILTGVFWATSGKEIRILSDAENLNQHGYERGYRFITHKFGHPVNNKVLDDLARSACAKEAGDSTPAAVERYVRSVAGIVSTSILEYLEYHNQRTTIRYSSDMFAERTLMRMDRDNVNIIYKHNPLETSRAIRSAVDPRVIVDYKEHFPRIDLFLEFIAAARFSRDRKKAYLWIQAATDWGKGLLMGALSELGCSVNLNMADLERMIEGGPSGQSPEAFKRKFVLNLNEVKSIKREIKEVESTLSMSPKYQMTTTVDVYAKILWSADNIPSLVGEEGVEDQLANRINVFNEVATGSIHDRKLFNDVGAAVYFDNLVYYIRDTLNRLLDTYVAMGVGESERKAQQWLNEFHAQHNVGRAHGRLSEALPRMAESLMLDIKGAVFHEQQGIGVRNDGDNWYISSPKKFVNDWIKRTYSHSEIGMHMPKVDDLLRMISADGSGKAIPMRVAGSLVRVLKIK